MNSSLVVDDHQDFEGHVVIGFVIISKKFVQDILGDDAVKRVKNFSYVLGRENLITIDEHLKLFKAAEEALKLIPSTQEVWFTIDL